MVISGLGLLEGGDNGLNGKKIWLKFTILMSSLQSGLTIGVLFAFGQ